MEDLLHLFLYEWHARDAADKDDVVDVLWFQFCVLERLLAGSFTAVDDRPDDLFEFRARKLHLQMGRLPVDHRDVR